MIGDSNLIPDESMAGCGVIIGAETIVGELLTVGEDDIIGVGDCIIIGPIDAGAETIIGDDDIIGFMIMEDRVGRAVPSASICNRERTCGCSRLTASDR